MARTARQISNLVIDEISLVDKGANQHAVVTIAKSADGENKENEMEIFDEQGNPLDVADLNEGDIVYDGEGTAYAMELDDEAGDEQEEEFEEEDERELESVGKRYAGFRTVDAPSMGSRLTRAGMKTRHAASSFKPGAAGNRRRGPLTEGQNYARRVRGATAGAGGAAALGGGGAVAYDRKVRKNFTEEIREELSKALTDSDREEVITKALGRVDEMAQEMEIAKSVAEQERELRMEREYTEIAKSYNLPVADEDLGRVLMNCAEALPVEDCEIIHKAFEAAGAAIFEEYGQVGGGDNVDVYSQIEEHIGQMVSKSGMSHEEAMSDFFMENPDAYDEYLSER